MNPNFEMLSTQLAACLLVCLAAPNGQASSNCEGERVKGYLQVASDLISKAQVLLVKNDRLNHCPEYPADCAEVLNCGNEESGIYRVWPWSRILSPEVKGVDVYCDMATDGGGWTVIQRRGDYGRPEDYFKQNWDIYKDGFGSLVRDFYLGNDLISILTNQRRYSIRFDLTDMEGESRYAIYEQFWIEDETYNYTLHVSGYFGTAGDSFTGHDKMQFSTRDRDNDVWEKNCADQFKGGWWYSKCHSSNLNGLFLKGPHESYADGVEWSSWKGQRYSLLKTEMKIRPENFKLSGESIVNNNTSGCPV